MIKKYYLPALCVLGLAASVSSCKKDDNTNVDPVPKSFTIPTTYSFGNANYTKATQRVKMAVELDTYLKKANTGWTVVALDQSVVNSMFNSGTGFTDATLNTAGVTLKEASAEPELLKAFADSVLVYNTADSAYAGKGGYVKRSANKIVVGPKGLEYGQAYTKGIMGGLFFKEAVRLLTSVKAQKVADTAAAQALWDDAFGYLSIPANYDTSIVYASTDANKPLLWGGYLYERGRSIQAGGTIFSAFLKGRAAIGAYDKSVRDAQVDIILNKWEQTAAAAALAYVTSPTASANIGNLGAQLHALSEGFGFIHSLKYRASTSKLSAADFETLNTIIHKDFYVLINQSGFNDLVTAQNILKNTYGL